VEKKKLTRPQQQKSDMKIEADKVESVFITLSELRHKLFTYAVIFLHRIAQLEGNGFKIRILLCKRVSVKRKTAMLQYRRDEIAASDRAAPWCFRIPVEIPWRSVPEGQQLVDNAMFHGGFREIVKGINAGGADGKAVPDIRFS
jgi:hypothetical protein